MSFNLKYPIHLKQDLSIARLQILHNRYIYRFRFEPFLHIAFRPFQHFLFVMIVCWFIVFIRFFILVFVVVVFFRWFSCWLRFLCICSWRRFFSVIYCFDLFFQPFLAFLKRVLFEINEHFRSQYDSEPFRGAFFKGNI